MCGLMLSGVPVADVERRVLPRVNSDDGEVGSQTRAGTGGKKLRFALGLNCAVERTVGHRARFRH